jgi:hypothetical protein
VEVETITGKRKKEKVRIERKDERRKINVEEKMR